MAQLLPNPTVPDAIIVIGRLPTCWLEGPNEAEDKDQEVWRVCYVKGDYIRTEHQEHFPIQNGLLLLG